MGILIARFGVTGMDDQAVQPDGGEPWVSGLTMRKTYTAGLVGSGILVFLHSGTEDSRGYVAVERITGVSEDGRRGSFTVHHGAVNAPGGDHGFGYIVPGTGTEDFADVAGSASIEHDDAGAYFVFDLA